MALITNVGSSGCRTKLALLDGGVLMFTVHGPLTARGILEIKRAILALEEPSIRCFLADFSRAAVLVTRDDMDAALSGESADSAVVQPAAMVVRPEDVPMFREHAVRMALAGIPRRVFTDRRPALEWVVQASGSG